MLFQSLQIILISPEGPHKSTVFDYGYSVKLTVYETLKCTFVVYLYDETYLLCLSNNQNTWIGQWSRVRLLDKCIRKPNDMVLV